MGQELEENLTKIYLFLRTENFRYVAKSPIFWGLIGEVHKFTQEPACGVSCNVKAFMPAYPTKMRIVMN